MRKAQFLSILLFLAGFVFLLSLPAVSGPPLQLKKRVKQPAESSSAAEATQVPRQAEKRYAIAIRNLDLNSKCQVTFTLKNTGADLTAEQHKNSYVKVGQNPRIRLPDFDRGGRLKTSGQSLTYLENEPLTQNTYVAVEVTLFDGSKKTKRKFLKPTCPAPKNVTAQPMTPAPAGAKPIPQTMSPQGDDSPSEKKLNITREAVPQPDPGKFKTPQRIKKTIEPDLLRIVVTSPKAGDAWIKNETYMIKWNRFGDLRSTVSISLRRAADNSLVDILREPSSNSGYFKWTIPESIPPGRYKILVKVLKSNVSDVSDEFRIVKELKTLPTDLSAKQVIVTKPAAGQRYKPEDHIPIEWETQLHKQIQDRHSRRRQAFDTDGAASALLSTDSYFPPVAGAKPETARVGFWYYVNFQENVLYTGYLYTGYIFRSQIVFPIENLRKPGRAITKATLYLSADQNHIEAAGWVTRNPRPVTCGGKLYLLTAPWAGRCIDTPGYEIAALPNKKPAEIDVTGFVQDWFAGAAQNHGFLLGSLDESFEVPGCVNSGEGDCISSCLSWYRAVLNLEMLERDY